MTTRMLFYLSGFKDEEAAAIEGTPPVEYSLR